MWKRVAIFAAVMTLLGGCASTGNHDFDARDLSDKDLNQQQVGQAILSGALNAGWTPRLQEPGTIRSRIDQRDQSVTVDIVYDADRYDIKGRDSDNLDDDNDASELDYEDWVVNLGAALDQAIDRKSARLE